MLAKSISKPFFGKDWIFEYLMLLILFLDSRNGNEFKFDFPQL